MEKPATDIFTVRKFRKLHRQIIVVTAVLLAFDCAAAWSFTYSWAASLENFAALEKRNASVFNYNVSGAISSYCDANYQRYRNTYCKHNLPLQVGQTAELTIRPNVSKGAAQKISFGVLPWGHFSFRSGSVDYGGWAPVFATLDNSNLVYGLYGVDSYSYARPFETIVKHVGSGMWDYSIGSSETIKISCTKASHSYDYVIGNITEYEYEISDTCGRYKKVTIDVYDDEEAFKAWASAGITLFASLMDKNGGTHDNAVAYTVTEQLYWTDEGRRPDNDDFADAATISGASGSVSGTNVGATTQGGEKLLSFASYATRTIWWKWTAPFSGRACFDTIGTSFDTVMGVYTGTSLSALSVVAEDDDGAVGQSSRCEFDCAGGKTYYICVGSGQSGSGSISLNWNLTASQPDLQVTALTVSPTEVDVSQALTVNYTVKNVGNAAAASSAVYVYDGSTLVASATKTGVLAVGGTYSGTHAFAAGSLAPGTHDIRVKADGGGNVSESNENNNTKTVSVSVRDSNAPTKVTASDGSSADGVQVSWTTASGVTSCNLYRSTTTVRPSLPLRSAVTSPCDDATATPGVKYYYWVEAIHSAGSSFSTFDTGYRAVSLSLGKSEDSYGQAGGNGSVPVLANTSWSASSDADWITLEAKAGNGDGTLTYVVAPNTSAYSRAGMIAVTAGTDTAYPMTAKVAVAQTAAAPSMPTGVIASDGTDADKVCVRWAEASGVASYNLYRSTTSNRPSAAMKTGVTSPCDDATAIPGVEYHYWVEAVNSAGSAIGPCDVGHRAVSLSLGKMSDAWARSGGNGNVAVSANTSWSASSKTSWIALGTCSGNGDGRLTYVVATNAAMNARTGSIVVTAGSDTLHPAEVTIVVEQAAVPNIGGDWFVDVANGSDLSDGTSWSSSFATLQKAIDAAGDGQTIVVNDGVYGPIDAKGKSLTIRSVNGAKRTTIDGARETRCATLWPSQTMLDGFTIMNGAAGGSQYGGGVLGGILRDCVVTSCSAVPLGFGGGVASNVLHGCIVVGNVACIGGGGYDCEWHECIISNNHAGAYAVSQMPTMKSLNGINLNKLITDLTGCCGGFFGGNAERCVIRDNVCLTLGKGCGGVGAAMLDSCLVANNVTEGSVSGGASDAGGVGTCVCLNCTIAGNVSFYSGGSDVWNSHLTNCIVKSESAGGVRDSDCYRVCVNDTAVGGEGMIYEDPQFVDVGIGDFRLKPTSPCVDSGDASVVTAEVDLECHPRVVGVSVDLGAYEWQDDPFVPLGELQYGILFDVQGGGEKVSPQVCDSGHVYKLSKCIPHPGKRFAGWACSNGKRYDDGMLVFNLAQPGETVTMTAIWE